jgi:ribonuclease HI
MNNRDLYYISERSGWSEDKIKFFLKNKIHTVSGALRADISWPEQYIQKIESLNHFSLFDSFSYEQMCQYISDNEHSFSEVTVTLCTNIDKYPHHFSCYEHNFSEQPCLIMVDASLKKNGKEYFAGIAGCIRTEDGTIVCGFAQELDNAHTLNSREIELLSIREGIDIAKSYGLKNYQIVSDCVGNVFNIHRALHGITPHTDDFFDNRNIFEDIIKQLKEDNASVAYVPRKYNNIADEFSKTFYRRQSEIFNLKKAEIYYQSNLVLSGAVSQIEDEVYFTHPKKLNFDNTNNPYNMDKNSHLDYAYNNEEHGKFDYFFMPLYNRIDKSFYNFFIDLNSETIALTSVVQAQYPDNTLLNILDNLTQNFQQFSDKKIAVFADSGVCATIHCLTPVKEEYLDSWKKLYNSMEHCSGFAFFNCQKKWINKAKNYLKTIPEKNNDILKPNYR